jgi:hypothetical protein
MKSITTVAEYIRKIQQITSNESSIANNELIRIKNMYRQQQQNKDYANVIEENNKSILEEIAKNKNRYYESDNQHTNDWITSSYKYKFFYRGNYSISYKLTPSVFREKNWDNEDYYYHEIMVLCPDKFQFLSHLDKLVLMQHFDCPTRLLDVTSNPLVALYFACKNFKCKLCDLSTAGQVFIFPILSEKVAYSDSDKALMISCIPRFTAQEKKELYYRCIENLKRGKFPKRDDIYEDAIVEKFFHEITTELPSFKREVKPIDLLQPLFIQPNKSNGRILKQDGAFILNGLSNNYDEALTKMESITYKAIPIENQNGILAELEQLGIHEAALFPEVDKVANYLKEKVNL